MLHQFEQHSISRRRMNKRYETITGAYTWCFINQSRALVLQLRERSANVFNLNRDVMHAGTPFCQELPHRSVRSERFQQFDVGITHSQHANLYTLFRNFFARMNLQAERIPPNCQTLFNAPGGDADVIKFHLLLFLVLCALYFVCWLKISNKGEGNDSVD